MQVEEMTKGAEGVIKSSSLCKNTLNRIVTWINDSL